jgi:hypothetical protein
VYQATKIKRLFRFSEIDRLESSVWKNKRKTLFSCAVRNPALRGAFRAYRSLASGSGARAAMPLDGPAV